MTDTLASLKRLIHEKFEIDEATLVGDKPLSDYGLDSLSLIEFLFVVEEHFKIEIEQNETGIDTLAGLAALIDERRPVQVA